MVAPIRDDQPVVAGQVVDAVAGVRVRFGRVTVQKLASAVDSVLDDPEYRDGAHRIRTAFRSAGGARAAALHLGDLAVRQVVSAAARDGSAMSTRAAPTSRDTLAHRESADAAPRRTGTAREFR